MTDDDGSHAALDRPPLYHQSMHLIAAAFVLILATSPAGAETIAGRASVIDGDTIDIYGERIRILDIDAPEIDQTCFPFAAAASRGHVDNGPLAPSLNG